MTELSPRQGEVYRYILDYRKQHGIPPARKEIADGIGVSLSTVTAHIRALQTKEYVAWTPYVPRSLRLLK
jgi:repressor LexA